MVDYRSTGQLIEDQQIKERLVHFGTAAQLAQSDCLWGKTNSQYWTLVQQLGKDKSLLRLQLKDVDLTRADLAAVTQMKQLKVLDLSTNEAQPSLRSAYGC